MNDETWNAVDEYFEAALIATDAVLVAALRTSEAAGLPPIHVSASQGKFLQLLPPDARRTTDFGGRHLAQAALAMSRVGSLILVDNVVRVGAVVAKHRDAAAKGVRRMTDWMSREPRLSATVIQTVGHKGYDGFLSARVLNQ